MIYSTIFFKMIYWHLKLNFEFFLYITLEFWRRGDADVSFELKCVKERTTNAIIN